MNTSTCQFFVKAHLSGTLQCDSVVTGAKKIQLKDMHMMSNSITQLRYSLADRGVQLQTQEQILFLVERLKKMTKAKLRKRKGKGASFIKWQMLPVYRQFCNNYCNNN